MTPSWNVGPVEECDFTPLSVVAAAAYACAYADLWGDAALFASRLQRFTPEALRTWAEEADMRLWIARVDAAPVGFLGLRLASPDPVDGAPAAELHRVYLLPQAVGRGLGRALLDVAETTARESGASALWLKSMAAARARAAYARWGFRQVGVDRLDNDLPAAAAMVVLRKDLTP